MLGIVKDSKIIPLTTDTGTGASVGTLIQQYKKKPMSGYLYCDGSTFDQNAYPALYMYLGTNVLPDYRECVMVGAEENTTDTIAAHDVYGEGEFKDDQLQIHEHIIGTQNTGTYTGGYSIRGHTDGLGEVTVNIDTTSPVNARASTTTHGKQKAVYVYIKATSGLAENQQDNVLNDVKGYVDNSNSYSTQEVKTGGKWIDGKPIYRKTWIGITDYDGYNTIADLSALSVLKVIKVEQIYGHDSYIQGSYFSNSADRYRVLIQKSNMNLIVDANVDTEYVVILEYTKTTD